MKKLTRIAIGLITLTQFCNASYSEEVLTEKTSGISRKIIQRADIADGDEELRMMLVEFPPAYSNIVHIHPVGALCYVIKGTAESQYEGEELKVFHTGESYQDQANKKHLIFRNPSVSDNLQFTCTAKIKKDIQFMLLLAPNCK